MSRLSFRTLVVFLIVVCTAFVTVDGQQTGRTRGRNPEKSLFGKTRKVKTKDTKVKESPKVTAAIKKQEKKQDKIKKDYFNYVDASKKRAFKIQSPEVQARMKKNAKDTTDREKIKKKKKASATQRGAKKYRK
jgi:hypothetical protein